MLDIPLVITHWLIIPVGLLVTIRLAFGKLRYMSFPSVFVVAYFFLIHVRALEIYQHDISEPLYLVSVWITPFLFLVSAVGTQLAFRHSPRKICTAFREAASGPSRRDRCFAAFAPCLSALMILLPIVFILDKGLSGIALFFLLSNVGDATETMYLRIGGLVSNYSKLLTILYSYSRALIYPMYVSILTALRNKGLVSTPHLLLVICASVFYVVLTTAKAPLAILLLGMSVSGYLSGGRRAERRPLVLVLVALVALFLPALFYPLLYGAEGGEFAAVALESMWRRVTWVPSHTTAVYFDAFTNRFTHLGTSSNRFLALIFNADYIPAASFVYNNYYNPSIPGGLVNASFFASFYADWGMPGVIIGSLLLGAITVILQVYFDRQVDAVATGVRGTVVVATCQLLLTNFYSASMGRGFLSLPLFLMLGTAISNEVYRVYGRDRQHRKEVMLDECRQGIT